MPIYTHHLDFHEKVLEKTQLFRKSDHLRTDDYFSDQHILKGSGLQPDKGVEEGGDKSTSTEEDGDFSSLDSCWSLSAVHAIEGIVQIRTGKLEELSAQELMDSCACNADGSGDAKDAFKYVW
ncbi:hypothetical protein MLD38_039327 [Melastoma candidum]|uniref:Uncharacterized protein n=1 Tax=Melastoma candidum TaxID=119954 RepID=A0ACB9L1Q4_9MYRT|nr:hypothetical protein MLD38_039327 [Melastoma candidum]